MTSAAHTHAQPAADSAVHTPVHRLSTETKAAFKTTEFFAFLAAALAKAGSREPYTDHR